MKAPHTAALPLVLALPLFCAISACHREAVSLDVLAEFTFRDLTAGEPMGADLPLAPDRTLLVRVEGFEAGFESSVVNERGETLSLARLPYIRAGPVFHIIETGSEIEPTRVVIRPQQFTRDARITAKVFVSPAASRRDLARIEAYRAYEAATQSTDDESSELWRKRAAMLQSAASGFKRAGNREEQLWAEYLEAYVHYFPLAEYDHAAEMAAAVQQRAREQGHREIQLMANQLEGQALIERDEGDTPEAAQEKAERGQGVLERAGDLAAELSYRYEQAWAVNSRGIGYFYQARYDESEAHYAKALAIALELDDAAFENQVRGNLALVRERQGDLFGALAELQAINAQLRRAGAKAELAHNWSELSRIYQRLYAFPEAIEAQEHEFELWRQLNSAEGRGRAGLSLAYSYYAMGNMQRSLVAVGSAIADLETARYGRGLRDGIGLLANIHRGLGNFEAMVEARDRQADYLTSDVHRARYQYERGVDALARSPDQPSHADGAFEQAASLAQASGRSGLKLLAGLQRCAITPALAENCTTTEFGDALAAWLPKAPPSEAFEARYLQACNLDKLGRPAEAWALLDELIDDILLYRHTLPGVLGAWYWEGRVRIFDAYLELALKEFEAPSARAVRSLLAFNRLLNTSLGADAPVSKSTPPAGSDELRELRALLAQLETGDPAEAPGLRAEIDRRLLELSAGYGAAAAMRGAETLIETLENLPRDSALLAYYVGDDESWAWLAKPSGVQVFPLSLNGDLDAVIRRVRSGLRVVGNDRRQDDLARAGQLLLGPIEEDLPQTLFLLTAGALVGFPFEAVRHDGRYFGQQHAVVNILSLEALQRPRQWQAGAGSWRQLMLAGDPTGGGDHVLELPAAGRELDAVARLFHGKYITRRSGVDLGLELFYDEAMANADLIHISSHARIDLEYPELSRIMLSGAEDGGGYLTPLDIRRLSLQADLVVLSACETTGINHFSFDGNLGFVQAFLDSGADAVLATLWPVPDAFAADFMLEVYKAMLEGVNTPSALAQAKRRLISDATARDNLDWPAFQIYIN